MKFSILFILIILCSSLRSSQPASYFFLEEEIPDIAFAYIGSSPRETILYNPTASPLLEEYFELYLTTITPESSVQSILDGLSRFVSYKIFDPRLCNESETESLIDKYRTSENFFPEIPLEIFLKARTGLCRHVALCTSLMLDKLSKKGIIQGKTYLIRGQTPQGRHAWSLLVSKENAWHIDPYWGLIEDAKTLQGWESLCKKFGVEIMKEQKLKWD